jgi:hypothetical protein
VTLQARGWFYRSATRPRVFWLCHLLHAKKPLVIEKIDAREPHRHPLQQAGIAPNQTLPLEGRGANRHDDQPVAHL